MSSDVFRCSPWVAYEPPAGELDGNGDNETGAGNDFGAGEGPRAFTKFRVKLPGQQTRQSDSAQDGAHTPERDLADGSAMDADDDQPAPPGPVVVSIPSEHDQQAMMGAFELGPGQDWKTATVKPPRKKPTKRGGAAGSASATTGIARGGMRKAATIKNAQRAVIDVDEPADDVSYASSPAQYPRELSVEPDALPPASASHIPEAEPVTEATPVPSYAQPTRSFGVAPPLKPVNTAAKDVPIERNMPPVRRWRVARREIRGIAGGRWFARSWVGDNDSSWAGDNAAASAAAQLLSMAAGSTPSPGKLQKPLRRPGTGTASSSFLAPSSSPFRGGLRDLKAEDVTMLEL